MINLLLDLSEGRSNDEEVTRFLRMRDRRLRLDVDSSQLNFFFLDKLVELFPCARFILTIRDPYTWLGSFINQQLGYDTTETWIKFRDFRFRPELFTHGPEEMILREQGLYTLDGYLSYWQHHNRTAIDTVPRDRLLIIRTNEITRRVNEIAAFAGIENREVRKEDSHAYKAKTKFGVLEHLDREYLASKIREHCSDLIEELFPEVAVGGR